MRIFRSSSSHLQIVDSLSLLARDHHCWYRRKVTEDSKDLIISQTPPVCGLYFSPHPNFPAMPAWLLGGLMITRFRFFAAARRPDLKPTVNAYSSGLGHSIPGNSYFACMCLRLHCCTIPQDNTRHLSVGMYNDACVMTPFLYVIWQQSSAETSLFKLWRRLFHLKSALVDVALTGTRVFDGHFRDSDLY